MVPAGFLSPVQPSGALRRCAQGLRRHKAGGRRAPMGRPGVPLPSAPAAATLHLSGARRRRGPLQGGTRGSCPTSSPLPLPPCGARKRRGPLLGEPRVPVPRAAPLPLPPCAGGLLVAAETAMSRSSEVDWAPLPHNENRLYTRVGVCSPWSLLEMLASSFNRARASRALQNSAFVNNSSFNFFRASSAVAMLSMSNVAAHTFTRTSPPPPWSRTAGPCCFASGR